MSNYSRRESTCQMCRFMRKDQPAIYFKGLRYWCDKKEEWVQPLSKICQMYKLDIFKV